MAILVLAWRGVPLPFEIFQRRVGTPLQSHWPQWETRCGARSAVVLDLFMLLLCCARHDGFLTKRVQLQKPGRMPLGSPLRPSPSLAVQFLVTVQCWMP